MGFFDKLSSFLSTASKVSDKAMDVYTQTKNISDTFSNNGKASSDRKPGKTVDQRIRNVCARSFPEYILKSGIPASEVNAGYDARNFSFMLFKDNSPKLAIMVLSGHNDYAKKDVRAAHEACHTYGINCINIMTYLPSTEEYITDRIMANIR